eukprot:COSAG02_NODE_356_length_23978_cov_7.868504_13_plen_75_part_00
MAQQACEPAVAATARQQERDPNEVRTRAEKITDAFRREEKRMLARIAGQDTIIHKQNEALSDLAKVQRLMLRLR